MLGISTAAATIERTVFVLGMFWRDNIPQEFLNVRFVM
jgi:hypothetical protein